MVSKRVPWALYLGAPARFRVPLALELRPLNGAPLAIDLGPQLAPGVPWSPKGHVGF